MKVKEQPRNILRGDPNKAELVIPLIDGRNWCFKGLDKPDDRRGGHPVVIFCDEYAICPSGTWQSVLRPAIADKKSRVGFASTTRGRNHFYDMAKLGGYDDKTQRYNPMLAKPGWHYYYCSGEDTWTIPHEEILDMREGPNKMPEADYNQEVLSQFLGYTGTMVGQFINWPWETEGGNLVSYKWWMNRMEQYRKKKDMMFFRVIDWAIGGTTVCIWVAVDHEGRKIVFDEYSCTGKTVPMITKDILARHTDIPIGVTVMDKSMWNRGNDEFNQTLFDQFRKHGIHGTKSLSGFDESVELLNTLCASPREDVMPMFVIVQGMARLTTGQMNTIWNQYPDRNGADKIGKQECDGFDCARYAAMLGVASIEQRTGRDPEAPDESVRGPFYETVRALERAKQARMNGIAAGPNTAQIEDLMEQDLDPVTGRPA